ncbi:MAG: ABC transporter substrate-binding protein [Gammaproteobacteria bacterium]|nr:ABC transporter substrate-binding protein [Gammaproteobacteria bacterium]MCF6258847.1 ABC transporter substrate-binding protein [Gammaproteobacteria bacterium]
MINVISVMKYTGALLASMLLLGSSVATVQAPEVLVQETTDKITSILRVEQDKIKAEPGRLLEIVDTIVAPHFDFERMSSWVLGKYWRKASADEKKRFAQEFRTLLVRTYAKALNDNFDKQIDMLAPRKRKDGKQVTVRTEIQQSGGFPIPISYKMHMKEGAWKIFDVSVDGISLVANYRSSFAKEIRKDGLEKLIARLADRNQPAKAANTAK